jgi:fructose-1,6-bisphosphatase/inositol monophosphatase family enzyme
MTSAVDVDRVAQLISEVAAEEILPRYMKLALSDVREKSPGDFVTVADEAVERRLAPALSAMLPDSVVLGEEEAANDPSIIDLLDGKAPVWVIDPIDGTANFAESRGDFGVMVSLVRAGRTLAAWIHDPRRGAMARAELGSGAWLDGRRLRVAQAPADPAALTGALLAGFHGSPELGRRIHQRRGSVRAVKSLRCAAAEYVRLADGHIHFVLWSKLMPWDHAAGVLLHAEAGGYNAYLDGGHYLPIRIKAPGLLLTPDEASWQALYERLIAP